MMGQEGKQSGSIVLRKKIETGFEVVQRSLLSERKWKDILCRGAEAREPTAESLVRRIWMLGLSEAFCILLEITEYSRDVTDTFPDLEKKKSMSSFLPHTLGENFLRS